MVRLENEEQRWEVLGKKVQLKGRKERIMEDLTWEERRLRWRLEGFARIEEKKGKRVWVGNGRVKIDGYWWKWDEKEEVLKDGRRNMREIEQGEGKEEGESREKKEGNGKIEEGRGENKEREEGEWSIVFWNVAGREIKTGIFGWI